MKSDTDILTEIRDISPLLASLKDINVFTVPEGYFGTLADDIQERVLTTALADKISATKPVQSVPDGYFENLSAIILKRINSGDSGNETELSPYPFLSKGAGINIFKVPDGYFEGLPAEILNKIKENPRAMVFPIFKRRILRYVAAAVVALGLLTSGYLIFTPDTGQNSFAVVNKSTVPYQDALKYNSEKAFEKGLASLTDDQIINYLENHGSILDDDQLVKNTNVSGMPEPMDYIENEHALEDYLKTISSTGSELKN